MPCILVVNDDGIKAPGLIMLVEHLSKIPGCDVFVVAPTDEQSAKSHSITIRTPLEAEIRNVKGAKFSWAVAGTPADCTSLALDGLFPNVRFDCVVSGINRGDNASRHVVYSGTVAGAREAAFRGLVSISTSLDSFAADANYFDAAANTAAFVSHLLLSCTKDTLLQELRGRVININYPAVPHGQIKGWRAALPGTWTYRGSWCLTNANCDFASISHDAKTLENTLPMPSNDQAAAVAKCPTLDIGKNKLLKPGTKYIFKNRMEPAYKDL